MARVVDSSVLIGMERRGLDLEAIASIVPEDEELALAAVTVAEMLPGVYRADSLIRQVRRESFLEAVLQAIPVVPFDLLSQGQSIGVHDAQIAATAITLGFGILTENVKDFVRISGLDVAVPHWP